MRLGRRGRGLGGDGAQLRGSVVRGGWDGRDSARELEEAEAARERDALRGSTMPARIGGPPRSRTPPRRGAQAPPALLRKEGVAAQRPSNARRSAGSARQGRVVHRDESSQKFYERTGPLVGSLGVMFAALVFVVLSVDEVQEMGKQCGSDPCRNGARCSDVVLPGTGGSSDEYAFKCVCRAGYDGTTCDQDIDECESGPCQNGGACVDDVDGKKTALFEPFIYKNDHFTKTGSGQT
eukprot:COSAG06_NODE_14166_length_1182_cov_3141.701754_2_plen_237_part_00